MSEKKPEVVLEIIELEEGELAIRNPESDSAEPMIVLSFSDVIRERLDDQYLDVARIMLTAGVQVIAETGLDLSEPALEPEPVPVVLH